jgi:hypothetical protein
MIIEEKYETQKAVGINQTLFILKPFKLASILIIKVCIRNTPKLLGAKNDVMRLLYREI